MYSVLIRQGEGACRRLLDGSGEIIGFFVLVHEGMVDLLDLFRSVIQELDRGCGGRGWHTGGTGVR